MFYFMSGDMVKEAALPMNTSHDALRGHLSKALKVAHGQPADQWSSDGPWIHDVFPGHVVYQHKGQTMKRSYTATQGSAGTDPSIKLGDSSKVHVAYVDSKEANLENALFHSSGTVLNTQESEPEQVRESAMFDESVKVVEGSKLNTIPIKIISPGWGSMAYYSKEVLQRDGPTVFKKGTPMYWNHATATEEIERPEGDLNNMAAILTKNAEWKENGVKGPGLYSEAKVFSDYATQIDDKGAHIGVSINAGIKAHEGEAEGRKGRIADKFVYAYSTDFVTKAGAGGAPIVPVSESDRGPQPNPKEKETTMTEAEIKALQDKNAELEGRVKTMEAGQNHILAVATVGSVLKEAGIKFSQKLIERACINPVMKEGKPDPDWIKGVVADFTEGQTGKVTGLGGLPEDTKAQEAADKKFGEYMKELGVPEAGLKFATGGGD